MTQVAQPTLTWELWLTPFPKAVGEARRQVSSPLTGWPVPEDAVETAVLITSEPVTNANRHCDTRHRDPVGKTVWATVPRWSTQ
ncbi:hypothetical protein [Streptomyces sp. BE230]|uniref:hypothetical protein n=1 Tax=Streptomyces sp. BE230 TaxID=3002526 RepID=UPI002ED43710|nr:hypothetical protein [Streptomyces sp. BE230]